MDLSRVRIPGTKVQGWRAIVVGVLALYILLFIVLNDRKLKINFVFLETRSNELFSLILIAALGFIAGVVVTGRRQRARAAQAQPRSLESTSPAPADQGTTADQNPTGPS